MPKPLNLLKARPILTGFWPDKRVTLSEASGLCFVYLGDKSEPEFFGRTWDEVMTKAAATIYSKLETPSA